MKNGRRTRRTKRNNKTKFTLPLGVVAMYAPYAGPVHAEPSGRERLVHFEFGIKTRGSKSSWIRKSVDYFVDPNVSLSFSKDYYPVDPVVEAKTGLLYEIPKKYAAYANEIRGLVTADVLDHLAERYQPNELLDQKTSIDIVLFAPPSASKKVGAAGIQEATKQSLKDVCRYDLQIDLSRGCPAAISPYGYASPREGCGYCYCHLDDKYGGEKTHSFDQEKASKQLRRLSRLRSAQGKDTKTICIGVNADSGYSFYRTELITLLEFCVHEGLTPVVRSKFLEYDSIVSDLLKRSGGVLVVSLGNDSLEPGLVAHGRTQSVRIADGLRYLKEGVHVVAGVVADPAQLDGGPLFSEALQVAVSLFPSVVIYALRAKSGTLGDQFFGNGFQSRTTRNGQLAYEKQGSQYLAAIVHPSIRKMIGKNRGKVRLCLKSGAGTYCGACHVRGGKGVALKGVKKTSPRRVNTTKRRAQ
ncbi:MAG: hypothetical protein GY847_41980 [Proteobacteria bacterium]|nr:hypothetical protein [Pseudomonadota bacterium]